MFYTYIIKSIKDNNCYIGYTSDLKKRLKEHNLKLNESTKHRTPFKIIYYEAYASKDDAIKREHNLKLRARAFAQLKLRIRKSLKN